MPRPEKKSKWGYVLAGVVGFTLSYVLNPAKDFVVDVFKSGPEITRTIDIDESELKTFVTKFDGALENVTITALQQSPEAEDIIYELDELKEAALKEYKEAVRLLKSNVSGGTTKARKRLKTCLEILGKIDEMKFESKGFSLNTTNRIKGAVQSFMVHVKLLLDQPMVIQVNPREKKTK